MREAQVHIKKHYKAEIITLSWGGVVSQLGFIEYLLNGIY